MINITQFKDYVQSFEVMLERYRIALAEEPNSMFRKGQVKNTEEYLEELHEQLHSMTQKNVVSLNEQTL
jgi:hypothetical protein